MGLVVKKAASKSAPAAAAKKATKKAAKKASNPNNAIHAPGDRVEGKTTGFGIAEALRFILEANLVAGGLMKDKDRYHKDTPLPKTLKIGSPWTDEELKAWQQREFPGRTSSAFCNISNARRMYNTATMRHMPGLAGKATSVPFAKDEAGNLVALEPGKRVAPKAAPAKAAAKAAPAKKVVKVVKKAAAKKAAPKMGKAK